MCYDGTKFLLEKIVHGLSVKSFKIEFFTFHIPQDNVL